jgi:hypothetical protein
MRRVAAVPSFQQFMLRRESIHLYRQVWRLSRHLDPAAASEIRHFAKSMFIQHKSVDDPNTIKFLIADGKRQIKVLQESVFMIQ